MQDDLLKNNDLANAGRKYAQSGASEKISEASSLPREGLDGGEGPGDEELQPLGSMHRTQVLQALGMIRGHCVMGPAEKIEEDGRKALAHNQATQNLSQMEVHGFGDKEIHLIRATLAANGHYAMDMRDVVDVDIDSMGILGPEGHPNAARGAEREKRFRISDRRRRKAKSQKSVQKEGARDGT
jgi:hypothetical protein